MKRDMDLFRELLTTMVEETPPGGDPNDAIASIIESEGQDRVMEHLGWIADANLVEVETIHGIGERTPLHLVHRVTNDGQDFYDAVKADTVWTAVKDRVSQVGGFTLSLIVELAKAELARRLGLG